MLKNTPIFADTGDEIRFDEGVHPDVISQLRIEVNGGKNCPKESAPAQDFLPGRAIYVKRGKSRFLCVKCASGWVGFNRLSLGGPGGKALRPVDFYNGYINQHRQREQYFGKIAGTPS